MSWQKLTLHIPATAEEEISELLNDLGAVAITLEDAQDQPIFEPLPDTTPLWQAIKLSVLFPQQSDIKKIIEIIKNITDAREPIIETIAEQNWQQICQDQFQPMCFSKQLWICPTWSTPPHPEQPTVVLDPGLAFGTGSHPTTRLCLEWLANNISHHLQVIDYGCGSGILAIAALKLGAQTVWAVDNDPQALTATHNNSQLNQLTSIQLHTVLPNELPLMKADVLIANILANPLIQLAPLFAEHVKVTGKIFLSGILQSQMEAVLTAYQSWFIMSTPKLYDEWIGIEGIRY